MEILQTIPAGAITYILIERMDKTLCIAPVCVDDEGVEVFDEV